MNANEVDQQPRHRDLGGVMGIEKPVHPERPREHGRSSNDTFPTAMHVAIAMMARDVLILGLEKLQGAGRGQGRGFGRTSSRSAAPTRRTPRPDAGPEFGGYAHQVEGMSGEAVLLGPSMNWRRAAPPSAPAEHEKGWDTAIAAEIAKITGLPFVTAPNKFEALAAHDAMGSSRARETVAGRFSRSPTTCGCWVRPALWSGRTDPAGKRAGLLDHAGQGEPDAGRGADHGLRAGHGQ